MHPADAFAAVEPQVIERERQLAAIALARAADDQLREQGGDSFASGQIVDRAGGDQDVDRRRPHVIHAFGQQSQAVGKRQVMNVLRHVDSLKLESTFGFYRKASSSATNG